MYLDLIRWDAMKNALTSPRLRCCLAMTSDATVGRAGGSADLKGHTVPLARPSAFGRCWARQIREPGWGSLPAPREHI